MRIGIPTEVKVLEGRVGLIPPACAELIAAGHEVMIQSGAGVKTGYSDQDYSQVGVKIVSDATTLYGEAKMIIKVKEPQPQELELLRDDHLLFCYLHLAAEPQLMQGLLDIGLTAVAFETVVENDLLPLLAPMSDIAGRLSVQIGTHLLHQPQGGRGVLLGGVPSTERGRVVILGAGVAGGNAARVAAAIGADVVVFDRRRDRLEAMRGLGDNVTALYPYGDSVAEQAQHADLLVGAVLVTGARAPHLVSEEMVKSMPSGSVIVDISVDQGGCVETTRPTTYADPTYLQHDVIHFAVTNMPGAVPRTASQALSAAITPYALRLADGDWRRDAGLVLGVNVGGGRIVHPELQALAGN